MRMTPQNFASASRANRSIQMTADAAPIGRVGTSPNLVATTADQETIWELGGLNARSALLIGWGKWALSTPAAARFS
jgi:hypothetical protein